MVTQLWTRSLASSGLHFVSTEMFFSQQLCVKIHPLKSWLKSKNKPARQNENQNCKEIHIQGLDAIFYCFISQLLISSLSFAPHLNKPKNGWKQSNSLRSSCVSRKISPGCLSDFLFVLLEITEMLSNFDLQIFWTLTRCLGDRWLLPGEAKPRVFDEAKWPNV